MKMLLALAAAGEAAFGLALLVHPPITEIRVLCRTQHRATYFTSFLYRYGYKKVYVVKGGIADWAEKGYPLYSKDFGEIKVLKYNKELREEYVVRPSMN